MLTSSILLDILLPETTVQAVFSSEHLRNPVKMHGVFANGLLVNNPDRGGKNALTAISRITITTKWIIHGNFDYVKGKGDYMRTPKPRYPGRYFINDRLKVQGKTLEWLRQRLAERGIDVQYTHLSSYIGDTKGGPKGDLVCKTADTILREQEEGSKHNGT